MKAEVVTLAEMAEDQALAELTEDKIEELAEKAAEKLPVWKQYARKRSVSSVSCVCAGEARTEKIVERGGVGHGDTVYFKWKENDRRSGGWNHAASASFEVLDATV